MHTTVDVRHEQSFKGVSFGAAWVEATRPQTLVTVTSFVVLGGKAATNQLGPTKLALNVSRMQQSTRKGVPVNEW